MIGEFLVENFDKVDLNGDGIITYVMFNSAQRLELRHEKTVIRSPDLIPRVPSNIA